MSHWRRQLNENRIMSTNIVIDSQPGLGPLRIKLRSFADGGFPSDVTAGESPAGTGNYVGGFAGIPDAAKQNGFVIAELWDSTNSVRLEKRMGKVTIDETNYLFAPAPTDLHSEQLDRMEAQTAQIFLQDKTIVVTTSTTGGLISIKKGSDYRVRNSTAINLTIPDVGGALAAILKDDTEVASIIFGAGVSDSANNITGTVSAADVTYLDNNTTQILIEITKEQTATAEPGLCYEWHVKGIAPVVTGEADGDEAVRLEGTLELSAERARS